MTTGIMEGVEVEVDTRPGGILASALPAPAGWIHGGLSIPFYGCGEPVLLDRCTLVGEDVPARTAVAEFLPFGVRQGATCSSLSRLDQKRHAEGRLDATTEWGVARQLATDILELGTPSFADGTSLGVVGGGDFITAVGILEQAAADAGFGAQWWLHAPVRAAAHLAAPALLKEEKSPSGAPWVISPGYPVQGPTTIRLWATGPVWAAVDDPFVINALDRTNNDDTAWADRSAVVAFDPCVNLFIDVTVPASPAP